VADIVEKRIFYWLICKNVNFSKRRSSARKYSVNLIVDTNQREILEKTKAILTCVSCQQVAIAG